MNNTNEETRKALVLWLSGMCLEDIRALPEVENLIKHGATVELEPSPITGLQTQHYQVFTGLSPAHFGFFDTLLPLCRHPQPNLYQAMDGYTVLEEIAGRSTPPKMLPDLLRAANWTVEYKEVAPSALVGCIQDLTQVASGSASCIIVKCAVESHTARQLEPTVAEAIEEAVRVARIWVGEAGLLAVLSESQPAPVKRFVNLNNFLTDMGIIECDEQTDLINWSNSLAYFVGHGQLWVNLLGRDPQGVVHPQDEYEEVRETLIQALPNKLRDPETGEQVIERVYRKEELYSGEYLFCAPDLFVLFKPGYAPSPRSTLLKLNEGTFTLPSTGQTAVAGIHPSAVGGFLLIATPAVAAGVSVPARAPLVAVVPTLLHALYIRYTGMDSPPVAAVFSSSYLTDHPIDAKVQDQELSEEEEELVINRLRDLGYI
jgi:hypothetical protein